MHNYQSYAQKHGIILEEIGPCQYCGSKVTGGVVACHENVHHLSNILDFNNPNHFQARFMSVDALALQHSELHGPWNNHIHLTRLYLIFEHKLHWDYSKTPKLSHIINQYKKHKTETLPPPPLLGRGELTTADLLTTTTANEAIAMVQLWAKSVFDAYGMHHQLVSKLAKNYIDTYGN